MKKKLAVITMNVEICEFYQKLLRQLFGDFANIYGYSIEDRTVMSLGTCDLYLTSCTSYDDRRNEWANSVILSVSPIVKSQVTFTKKALNMLTQYPKGTRAMLVNQSLHMAMETISQLYHLGVNNIEFEPVYPGMENIPQLDLAIAPGEVRYVKGDVKEVVDLGPRVFTANTVSEIALRLGNPEFLKSKKFKDYVDSLAIGDYSLSKLSYHNLTLENKLELIINSMEEGIVVVDEQDRVTDINQAALDFLQVLRWDVMDCFAGIVLPYIPFSLCRQAKGSLKPQLIRVGEVNLSLTLTPMRERGQYLGAFATIQKFEDAETKQHNLRMQMLKKGHHAKYTFEDIVGESSALLKACKIACKMAKTKASVLIIGESGTGKELFAHAIHNTSPRREGPFIAVNCAALTESLLESELFGYEEGAFTGAKKGGMAGLFEYAHRGSIFLDEIENMSSALQSKLLRVVQEKEVTRVGGREPIVVDVRIIAATNKDLHELVQAGDFRMDLYYRLSAMPILVPPLRERGEDIFLLMDYFKRQMNATFSLSSPVREAFLTHDWEGNVRELRNYVEYFVHLDIDHVQPEDLPVAFTRVNAVTVPPAVAQDTFHSSLDSDPVAAHVLGVLACFPLGRTAGRRSLVQACGQQGLEFTEYQVRAALKRLGEMGYVQQKKGRGGSRITPLGRQMIKIK